MITAKEARAIAEYASGKSDILNISEQRQAMLNVVWNILFSARRSGHGVRIWDIDSNIDNDAFQKALRYYKRLGYDIQQDGNKVTIKWGENE